ncbi:lytic transglycosylase domain-containing protein [Sphingobium sufflavum]|uniref:transglycosylase SLT domain-containing protein n=1 Tax=Sphingobium sufflavum TaxID=1129547 RepID=UPI001F2B6C5A|nr:transglycosylase SLT domain-containing protein [Sphingobium sufflavum]MCE7796051.1 lytic transglycosylase domain-containing protein [Sphingobium sufflavum]
MVGFSGIWGSQPASGSGERVTNAIADASRRTGVDFSYLMGQAQIESSMNPNAKARTSSATGLYQFLDQSWLAVMNNHGAEHGMEWAANAIQQGSNGRYYVSDPAVRQQILDLRKHPETASVMAAEFASDNRTYLESRTGRPAESVDLYLAHFLGAGGAAKFLTAADRNPDASGAALFPAAARANRSIFYDRQGNSRSLSDIRQSFAQKLDNSARNAGADADYVGNYDDYSIPSGSNRVQPADYLRIAQARLAAQDVSASGADEVVNANPGWADTSGETLAAMPRNEAARLAYLMLATLGR